MMASAYSVVACVCILGCMVRAVYSTAIAVPPSCKVDREALGEPTAGQFYADGHCDTGPGKYNTEKCGWDGGDCCKDTCYYPGNKRRCDQTKIWNEDECLQPADKCVVQNLLHVGDGYCDDGHKGTPGINTARCGWDRGDCCESTCTSKDEECGANKDLTPHGFRCKDPKIERCKPTCFGATCDSWKIEGGYTCAHVENTLGCDCTHCEQCFCPKSCNGKTCDEQVRDGYTCVGLEHVLGCDCRGCACNDGATHGHCEDTSAANQVDGFKDSIDQVCDDYDASNCGLAASFAGVGGSASTHCCACGGGSTFGKVTLFAGYPGSGVDYFVPTAVQFKVEPNLHDKKYVTFGGSNTLDDSAYRVCSFYCHQIIAPFWADIEVGCTAESCSDGAYYWQYYSAPNNFTEAMDEIIKEIFNPRFQSDSMLVATWDRVKGHKSTRQAVNSFQTLIATDSDGSGDTYVCNFYHELGWAAPNGRSEAELAGVGFEGPSTGQDWGPQLSYRHPWSGTTRVLELVSPGRYCYKISEKTICRAGHELHPTSGACKPEPCRLRPPRWVQPTTPGERNRMELAGDCPDIVKSGQTCRVVCPEHYETSTGDTEIKCVNGEWDVDSVGFCMSPKILVSPLSLSLVEGGESGSFTIEMFESPPTRTSVTIPVQVRRIPGISLHVTEDDPADKKNFATLERYGIKFTEFNWNTPRVIHVVPEDNDIAIGARAISIQLGPALATSMDSPFHNIVLDDVEVMLEDNDAPDIVISPSAGLITSEDAPSGCPDYIFSPRIGKFRNLPVGATGVAIKFSTEPLADVILTFSINSLEGRLCQAISSGVDTRNQTMTFSNQESRKDWNIYKPLVIVGVDDSVDDGNVEYDIAMTSSSKDPNYDKIQHSIKVTNVDNDVFGFSVSDSVFTVTECDTIGCAGNSVPASTMISLDAMPSTAVQMHLDCRPASECLVEPRFLNFNSENWWVAQKVIVKGQPDHIVDGTQTFKVYAALSSENSKYVREEKEIGRGQNSDVDTAGIDLFIEGASTHASDSKIFRIPEGSVGGFRFELRSKPTAPVDVSVSITDVDSSDSRRGSLPSSFPRKLTVTPDKWNSVDDNLFKLNCQRDTYAQDIFYKMLLKADSTDTNYNGQQSVAVIGMCVDGDTAGLKTKFLDSKGSDTVTIQGAQFSERAHETNSSLAVKFATNPIADVKLTFFSTNANEVKLLSPLEPQQILFPTAECSFEKRGYTPNKNFCRMTVESCGLKYCTSGGDGKCPHECAQPDVGLPPKFEIVLQSVDDGVQDGSQHFCIKVNLESKDKNYANNVTLLCGINTDDDVAGVLLTPSTDSTTEGSNDPAVFSVKLQSRPSSAVVVTSMLVGNDKTEVKPWAAITTITPDQWNEVHHFQFTSLDDDVDDGDQEVWMQFRMTSDDNLYNGDVGSVYVTNHDNDSSELIVASGTKTIQEGHGMVVQMKLSSSPAHEVIVTWKAGVVTGQVLKCVSERGNHKAVFNSNTWNVWQTFNISADDNFVSGDSVRAPYHFTTTSQDAAYNYFFYNESVYVQDDDHAEVIMFPATGETSEDGGTTEFSVVLTSKPSADVVINFEVSDDTEGELTKGRSLKFSSHNWNKIQAVVVGGIDDQVEDGTESYRLGASVSSNDAMYNNYYVAGRQLLNLDDDLATISFTHDSGSPRIVVTEDANAGVTFSAVLTSQPTANVNIFSECTDETEARFDLSRVIFTPQNWNQVQHFHLKPVDDDTVDGDQYFTLLWKATSRDPLYTGWSDAERAACRDNDVPGLLFNLTNMNNKVTEGEPGMVISIILSAEPSQEVIATIQVSPEGRVQSGSNGKDTVKFTFTPSNWNQAQTLMIYAFDDEIADGNQPIDILGKIESTDRVFDGVTAHATITALDNDEAGVNVDISSWYDNGMPVEGQVVTSENGLWATKFVVSLMSQPSSTVAVTFTTRAAGGDQSRIEATFDQSKIVFDQDNWNKPKTIQLSGKDDQFVDPGGIFKWIIEVTSNDASFGDPVNKEGKTEVMSGIAHNLDDDVAGADWRPKEGKTHETDPNRKVVIKFKLTARPTATVIVHGNVSNVESSIGQNIPAAKTYGSPLMFTTDDWNIEQKITVVGTHDSYPDGDKLYDVIFTTEKCDDPEFDRLELGKVRLINVDVDNAEMIIKSLDDAVTHLTESTQGTPMQSFSIMLASQPRGTVSIGRRGAENGNQVEWTGFNSDDKIVFGPDSWQTGQTVSLKATDDAVEDGDAKYSFTLFTESADDLFDGLVYNSSIWVIDNDRNGIVVSPASGLTIIHNSQNANDNTNPSTIEVSLSAQPKSTVEIDLALSKAANGETVATFVCQSSDCETHRVTFTPEIWNVAQSVQIKAVTTSLKDITTMLSFTLTPNTYAQISDFPVTISRSHTPRLITRIEHSLQVEETASTASFTLELSKKPLAGGDVVIKCASNDVTEVLVQEPNNGIIELSDADEYKSKRVVLRGVPDYVDDGDETVEVVCSIISGQTDLQGVSVNVVAINENIDKAEILVKYEPGAFTSEDGKPIRVNVTLSSQPSGEVLIQPWTDFADEVKVEEGQSQINFGPSNWDVAQELVLLGVDDAFADGDQLFTVLLTAKSVDSKYSSQIATIEALNMDNDDAGVNFYAKGLPITYEEHVKNSFDVVIKLLSKPFSEVLFTIKSSDPSEALVAYSYSSRKGSVSLNVSTGHWNHDHVIKVFPNNDDIADGDVKYELTLSAISADPAYNNVLLEKITAENVDDDVAGLVFSVHGSSVAVTHESDSGVATAAYDVRLSSEPRSPVTVTAVSEDLSEGSISSDPMVFTKDNWETHQKLELVGEDDVEVDGDIIYSVALSTISDDPKYSIGNLDPVSLNAINKDDDLAGFSLMPYGFETSEDGVQSFNISVSLDSRPQRPVEIVINVSDPKEAEASVKLLKIAPKFWDHSRYVAITGVDDSVDDGSVPFKVTFTMDSSDQAFAAAKHAAQVVECFNLDDDVSEILLSFGSGSGSPDNVPLRSTTERASDKWLSIFFQLSSKPTDSVQLDIRSQDATEGLLSLLKDEAEASSNAQITITPEKWNVPHTIYVMGVDDNIADGDQYYEISVTPATSDPNYASAGTTTKIVNHDDDSVNVLVESKSRNLATMESAEEDASQNSWTFDVKLATQPLFPVFIKISSTDNTEGKVSQTRLEFPAGKGWDEVKEVRVSGVDDDLVDGDQEFEVVLEIESLDEDYAAINLEPFKSINFDNDRAGLYFDMLDSSQPKQTSEDGGYFKAVLKLTARPTASVTVPLRIPLLAGDPDEGKVEPDQIIIQPNKWDHEHIVTITGVDDDKDDGDQEFYVWIFKTTSQDENFANLNSGLNHIVNVDNDRSGVLVDVPETESFETSEDGLKKFNFRLALTSSPTRDVRVIVTSSDPSEGVPFPSAVRFLPNTNEWKEGVRVQITGQPDDEVDRNQPYQINFRVDSLDLDYGNLNLGRSSLMLKNVDTDQAALVVDVDWSVGRTSENGGYEDFSVHLQSKPKGDVLVTFESTKPKEGRVTPSSVLFKRESYKQSRTIRITGVPDDVKDGEKGYMVKISTTSEEDVGYSKDNIDPVYLRLVNTDMTQAAVILSEPGNNRLGSLTTNENADARDHEDSFQISLLSKPSSDVTVELASTNANEGRVEPETLIITPDTWANARDVRVIGVDDNKDDGTIKYKIEFKVISDDPDYHRRELTSIEVSNKDDDVADFKVTVSNNHVSENGKTAKIRVFINSRPEKSITINLKVSDDTVATLDRSTIVFPPDEVDWFKAEYVTVTGIDNAIMDGKVPFTVTLTASGDDSDQAYSRLPPTVLQMDRLDDDVASLKISTSTLTVPENGKENAVLVVGLGSIPVKDAVVTVGVSMVTQFANHSLMHKPAVQLSASQLVFDSSNSNEELKLHVTGIDGAWTVLFQRDKHIREIYPSLYTQKHANHMRTDDYDDGNRIVVITLGPVTSTDSAFEALLPMQVTCVVIDDDAFGVAVTTPQPPPLYIMEEHDQDPEKGVEVRFKLTSKPRADVYLHATVSDRTEAKLWPCRRPSGKKYPLLCDRQTYYSSTEVVLKYTSETWNVFQALKILSVDDKIDDGPQFVQVGIVQVETEDPHYLALTSANLNVSAIIVNLDDDKAGAFVTPTALELQEDGDTKIFGIQLTSEPLGNVRVHFDIDEPTAATLSKTELTFDGGNWDRRQEVTVSPVDDNIITGDRESYIVFKVATSTENDDAYNGLRLLNNIKVVTHDNDVARVSIASSEETLHNSEAQPEQPAIVTVVLESIPTSDVAVTATLGNTLRGRTKPNNGQVLFSPDNWNQPQDIQIFAIDNHIDDENVEYNVSFDVSSADKSFDKLTLASMVVKTDDNDVAAVVLSTASNHEQLRVSSISTVSEPGRRLNLHTYENGTVAFINVSLNSEPRANVEILFYADGHQYSGVLSSKTGNETFVGVSSQTCQSNMYSLINNVESCAKAADAFVNAADVVVQNAMDKPSGCYKDETANQVFLNKAATGVKVGDADGLTLLCRSFSLIFTNAQGNYPWNQIQTIEILPEDDDHVTAQQWVLARAVKSQDPMYKNLAMSSIFVQYDDNDIMNAAAFFKAPVTEPFWNSSSGTLIIVVIICLALGLAALAIIFIMQRQAYKRKIKDERQKLYQHRQRILSESSDHEQSIVFRRSENDELNDDGNEFDDISAAGPAGTPTSATNAARKQSVGGRADDLASMELDYTSLVDRLVLQLQQLARSNVEMAQKLGVAVVEDVDQVIQSGNPTMLFEKIRDLKKANLSLSRMKRNDDSIDKKSVSSSSIVPVTLIQSTGVLDNGDSQI